jgi:TPP-dependent pyruvate/acetoin dehydrogenase alpha subunit
MKQGDTALHTRLYRALYRIRRVEEEIARVYPTDKIKSPVHLSIGQEPVAAGVCEALQAKDVVFGTYRSHAMYLAKGGDLDAMIAELYGKATGCARGKGGSMHLVDVARGVMGTSAVVGTTIPNALGYAYAMKRRGTKAIVASFFGDGATEEGVFFESLNFAALKRLPLLFVCENNAYAIHTHQSQRQAQTDICAKVTAFGMPAERIEGNDVLEIHRRTSAAAREMREGGGPRFFECMTYRWKEHVGPAEDFALGYRSKDELSPWLTGDQIPKLGQQLPADERAQIDASVEAELRAAFDAAERAPFPQPAALLEDLYKGR